MYMDLPSGESGVAAQARWEIVVPNGSYIVTIGTGDLTSGNAQDVIQAEGSTVVNFDPKDAGYGGGYGTEPYGSPGNAYFQETKSIVVVTDGRLTLDSLGGLNTVINYIDIAPLSTSFTMLTKLSATPTVVVQATARFVTAGRLNASGSLIRPAIAAFRATASLAGNVGVNILPRAASVGLRTQLRASGVAVVNASASVILRSRVTNSGVTVIRPAAAAVTARTQLGAAATLVKLSTAALKMVAQTAAIGIQRIVYPATASVVLQSSLSATGVLVINASGALTANTRLLSSVPIIVLPAAGGFNTYGHMTATGIYVLEAVSAITAQTNVEILGDPTLIILSSAVMTLQTSFQGHGKPFSAVLGGDIESHVHGPNVITSTVVAPTVLNLKVSKA